MIFKNIHKWFISLALLVSVVSFSGFTAETSVKQNVFTELIKTDRPISKSAVYYYRAILKIERPTNFSFKTLLKYYNLHANIQFITADLKVRDYLAHVTLIPVQHRFKKDNYSHIFIG
jgi:hypothetical protein